MIPGWDFGKESEHNLDMLSRLSNIVENIAIY